MGIIGRLLRFNGHFKRPKLKFGFTRPKRWGGWLLLGVLLIGLGAVGVIGLRVRAQRSPSTPTPTFTPTPTPNLAARIRWLPDQLPPDLKPPIHSRENIAKAYAVAWQQWALAHERGSPTGLEDFFSASALAQVRYAVTSTHELGWQVLQTDTLHTLQLTFASDDGTLVAFQDVDLPLQQLVRRKNSTEQYTLDLTHTFDVVMAVEEGRWRVRFLLRR